MAAPATVQVLGFPARNGRGKVTVEEAPQSDVAKATVEVSADGGLTVTVPSTKPNPDAKPKDDRFDRNLAEDMEQTALAALASYILDGVDADIQSRADWEETANIAADYLGVKLQDPTTSVSADGTVSKAVATCMLEATVKLWGTARAELLPAGGPVKVRRDNNGAVVQPTQTQGVSAAAAPPGAQVSSAAGIAGAQPTGLASPQPDQSTGDQIAAALESDLNHYLTTIDQEYYPDFSQMLLNRAVTGLAFRKVYRCPLRRRPVSVWVKAQNLIVSNDCTHLSGAGRITERIPMRQSTMRRMMVKGAYRDIVLVQPTGQTTKTEIAVAETEGVKAIPELPQDYEHMVYEVLVELGSTAFSNLVGDLSILDRDETGKRPGYPLPYRVSIDLDSREILEIRRHWKKGDPDHRQRKRYVKYGFIPGFGFYDWGLIHLVGNPTQAATMIQRAGVDATLFANFPGGVYLKGAGSRQANTVIRPNPGEFIGIDAAGASRVDDVIKPLPYKDPSQVMIAIQQKFEGDVRRVAGIVEIPVGESGMGTTPVGTIMSYIESVSQVPGAVHKDDHRAQLEEFELLRELFAEEPQALIAGNRSPARRWTVAQELLAPDLVPAADPNTPSQIHRLLNVQAKVAVGGLPQFNGIANNREIYRDVMTVLAGGSGDIQRYELPEAPAAPAMPPPQVQAAIIRSNSDQQKNQTALQKAVLDHNAKMQELQVETGERALDRQSEDFHAAATLAGKKIDAAHDTANAAADRAQDHAQHLDNMQQQNADRAVQQQATPLSAPLSGNGV